MKEDILGTYYAKDQGNEKLWGKLLDIITDKDSYQIACIYVHRNPLGKRIVMVPVPEVKKLIQQKRIWRH